MELQTVSSPPSSPGTPPIAAQECYEELVKFTLVSSIGGKLHTGLPNDYCHKLLLQLDDDQQQQLPFTLLPSSSSSDAPLEVPQGVPSYPLYKRLASSLYQSIHSGGFCREHKHKDIIPVYEDLSFLKKNEDQWNELILDKGHALLNMLKEVNYELHVQEPYFSQLKEGLKTVEGRCAVGDYKKIKSGDVLLFNKCLTRQVQDVHQYASFREMLEVESLAKVLPGVSSIEEGVQIYRNFYSEEKEYSNGVVAIRLEPPTSQLYDMMASMLSGLSYGGVQMALGFEHTTGTNFELLPPAISTLLQTFVTPHNPDVKGSTLTDGARALAKHVNRCSKGFWGSLHGNDAEKNKHALNVISHLLTHSRWLNMHVVPPHGIVFEIRNADGYGARWSGDGIKFIGFLEPYMVDGHSKGWKH